MSNMTLDNLSKEYVLKAGFFTQLSGRAGVVSAVDQVSFEMEEGEIIGLGVRLRKDYPRQDAAEDRGYHLRQRLH